MVRSALSLECFAYPPPRENAAAVRGILLGLAVDGCLPHGGAGVVVDAGKDGVDLIKEFIVALARRPTQEPLAGSVKPLPSSKVTRRKFGLEAR